LSPPFDSVGEILRHRARQEPDRLALRFLRDGGRSELCWSYARLDEAAGSVAGRLRAAAAPGERALLLYPPGLDYIAAFFGCLYSGVIAVPANPFGRGRDSIRRRRLAGIVADCRPAVALTLRSLLPSIADAEPPVWIATDDAAPTAAPRAPTVERDGVAFLQYTSGSTGAPRGVMVTHANLLHNLACIAECMGDLTGAHSVTWLPPEHDMGLIGAVLEPIHAGFPATLLSPMDFLQRPLRWLEAISRLRGTMSAAPNFAYDLCVRRTSPEQRAGLDLAAWRVAFTGSEPINPVTLDRFVEAFAPCGLQPKTLLPCYGLAEATLIASGRRRDGPPRVVSFRTDALVEGLASPVAVSDVASRALVSCGPAVPGQRIEIVDPDTARRLPENRVGEIWLSGPSVARGYWGRADETTRAFHARLADDPASPPFLRTGDLGFLDDGELFVTGRLKDLIIIAGFKHHAEDIERTAEASHPALRPGAGAAFSVTVQGQEGVAIVFEADGLGSPEASRDAERAVRGAVAEEHGITPAAVLLLKAGAVPRTSSGKVQRQACRIAFLNGGFEAR
jgi:acyl-CoA synthetase (AMP-forming)/AMP-acid ligase II